MNYFLVMTKLEIVVKKSDGYNYPGVLIDYLDRIIPDIASYCDIPINYYDKHYPLMLDT